MTFQESFITMFFFLLFLVCDVTAYKCAKVKIEAKGQPGEKFLFFVFSKIFFADEPKYGCKMCVFFIFWSFCTNNCAITVQLPFLQCVYYFFDLGIAAVKMYVRNILDQGWRIKTGIRKRGNRQRICFLVFFICWSLIIDIQRQFSDSCISLGPARNSLRKSLLYIFFCSLFKGQAQ